MKEDEVVRVSKLRGVEKRYDEDCRHPDLGLPPNLDGGALALGLWLAHG